MNLLKRKRVRVRPRIAHLMQIKAKKAMRVIARRKVLKRLKRLRKKMIRRKRASGHSAKSD